MASRICLFAIACLTALIVSMFGLVLPHDMNLATTEAKTLQDRNWKVETLVEQGNHEYRSSDYKKAIQFWQKSLDLYREVNNSIGEASTLNNLGRAYRNLSEYKLALGLHQQALTICKKIDVPKSGGKALITLKTFYKKLIESQQAFAYHQQLQDLNQQLNSLGCQAESLNNIGGVYGDLGDFQKSIDLSEQALLIFRQLGDHVGEVRALNSLGIVYDYAGKFRESVTFYQQALMIFKQFDDQLNEAKILNNLALVQRNLGQYQQALSLSQQSLTIAKQINDLQGEGNSLGTLGFIYRYLGQNQKAISLYSQSFNISQQIGDRQSEGLGLNGIGLSYRNLGQFELSLKNYQQSLPIFRQIEDFQSEANALNNMGNVYKNLGQYQSAIDLYLQALSIKQKINDLQGQARSLNNLGDAYNNLNQYSRAIDYYKKSLVIFRQIGDREAEGRVLSSFGSVISKLNQPELAILFYKQSVNVRESIRKDIRGLSQTEQKSYLTTVEKTYRNLADLLLKQDRILEAQQVLDLLKVEELNEYLRTPTRSSKTEQGTELRTTEKTFIALALELDDLQKRKLENKLTDSEQERLNQLVQSEREQNKQFTAFLNSPAVQKLVDELRRTEKQQNIDTENLRNLRTDILAQHPNAVLLYPLILEDRLELILVTTKTPPIRRTVKVKREELNDAIAEFRVELRDTTSSADVKKIAKQLHTWLIEPFAAELEQLKIDTIIYAPDGQLRYIPLASLYDGKQWIVEKYKINNITAASLTKFNKPAIAKPRIFAGAYGNINKAGFDGLPATLSEVKKIADRFPNTSTFVETAFTKNVTENNSNTYTVLHLATHGQLSNGKPEDSFILFGDGTKATISDIREWVLTNVDLVVLSACQSGLSSKLGNGVEILGLGYQMQAAGARVAIASLWKVDDVGTQALMEAFYSRLVGKQKQVIEATSHLFLHFNLYLNKHTHRNKLKHNKDSIAVIITQKQSKKDAQSRKDLKTR